MFSSGWRIIAHRHTKHVITGLYSSCHFCLIASFFLLERFVFSPEVAGNYVVVTDDGHCLNDPDN